MTTALALQLPHPDRLADDYLALMQAGDSTCPGDPEQLTDSMVYGCEASTGYYYIGIAEHYEQDGIRALGADFRIDTPAGETMRGGGGMERTHEGTDWSVLFAGTWRWTGSADAWLISGGSLWLEIFSDSDGFSLLGSFSATDRYLSTPGLTYSAADDTLTGTLQLRGDDQLWYDLTLGADGCGAVESSGAALGETCIDADPLIDSVLAMGAPP